MQQQTTHEFTSKNSFVQIFMYNSLQNPASPTSCQLTVNSEVIQIYIETVNTVNYYKVTSSYQNLEKSIVSIHLN